MTVHPDKFFGGRWIGQGEVCALGGRVLRRFGVSFVGTWSEPDRAFHLDESVAYADGRVLERRWVVHTDDAGVLTGFDNMGGRMRVKAQTDKLILRYDRPSGIGPTPGVRSLRLEISQPRPSQLVGRGVSRILGLPVARTSLALEASPEPGTADAAAWAASWNSTTSA
jgi:hypothetical protein